MADEQEVNPTLVFKDLPLMGDPIKIRLDCFEPVKTGENKFGNWYLWFGYVENATVWKGRRPHQEKIENYSGKVIFFPSEKLNEELIAAANGKLDVEVTVQRRAEEGRRGLITKYKVEKLSNGREPMSSLTPGEVKLLESVQNLINSGVVITEEDFIKAAQEPEYGGNISILRSKQLYEYLMSDSTS